VIHVVFFTKHAPALTPEVQLEKLNLLQSVQDVQDKCQVTVLLMRHCEKIGDETEDVRGNMHCSDVGFERANFIPSLFADDNNNSTSSSSRWPLPTKLYAMSRRRRGVHHLNFREIETLSPLRQKAGLDHIDARFSVGSERRLADDLFGSLGQMCGQVAVVNWKHSRMEQLAVALGCGPDEGCPKKYQKKQFDEMWQIRYEYKQDGVTTAPAGRRQTRSTATANTGHWSLHGSVVKEGFHRTTTRKKAKSRAKRVHV